MNGISISPSRKEHLRRIGAAILEEPKTIVAIGALILAAGMYAAMRTEPMSAVMLLGGAFGLWLGIVRFRKMRVRQSKMKRKQIYVPIALAAMFAIYGFMRMWNDIPSHTSIVLIGAFILVVGALQLKIKRGNNRR